MTESKKGTSSKFKHSSSIARSAHSFLRMAARPIDMIMEMIDDLDYSNYDEFDFEPRQGSVADHALGLHIIKKGIFRIEIIPTRVRTRNEKELLTRLYQWRDESLAAVDRAKKSASSPDMRDMIDKVVNHASDLFAILPRINALLTIGEERTVEEEVELFQLVLRKGAYKAEIDVLEGRPINPFNQKK